ncbi:MAG: DciA family protein [Phycisphaerae bacterium]|nr:DciA family protein [Phycisphaerae bacterium]
MTVRIYKRREPEHLGAIISRWIKRSRLLSHNVSDQVVGIWEECLGADAVHTRFRGVRRQIAYFDVDSAPLKAEIETIKKYDILTRMQGEIKKVFIRDIRLKACETIAESDSAGRL